MLSEGMQLATTIAHKKTCLGSAAEQYIYPPYLFWETQYPHIYLFLETQYPPCIARSHLQQAFDKARRAPVGAVSVPRGPGALWRDRLLAGSTDTAQAITTPASLAAGGEGIGVHTGSMPALNVGNPATAHRIAGCDAHPRRSVLPKRNILLSAQRRGNGGQPRPRNGGQSCRNAIAGCQPAPQPAVSPRRSARLPHGLRMIASPERRRLPHTEPLQGRSLHTETQTIFPPCGRGGPRSLGNTVTLARSSLLAK